MIDTDLTQSLETLFRQTAEAHHQAFMATDGDDPEWPLWYAGYLQQRLAAVLGSNITQSQLTYWLVRVDRAYRGEVGPPEWPTYYARDLLASVGELIA
jgi:hypothetical protein